MRLGEGCGTCNLDLGVVLREVSLLSRLRWVVDHVLAAKLEANLAAVCERLHVLLDRLVAMGLH